MMYGERIRYLGFFCLATAIAACSGDDLESEISASPSGTSSAVTAIGSSAAQDTSDSDSSEDTSVHDQSSERTTTSTGPASGDSRTAVTSAPAPLPAEPWDVFEEGPYRSGFTTWRDVTYIPRRDTEERSFRLRAWYPTLQTEGPGARYFNIFTRNRVFQGATLAENAPEEMPLLVFSHGNSSLAEQSYFMTEFFTSHGWIVIAPDHTNNTFADTQGSIDLRSGVFRPQDLSAAIDHMLNLPEDHFLHGRIDPDRIAVSGHSFGGYTSLAISGAELDVDRGLQECEESTQSFCDLLEDEAWVETLREGFLDERIGVSIPQTPGGYFVFEGGLDAVTTPTLLLTGGRDATLPNEEEGDPIWSEMRGSQHMRVDFETAGHFTFSNMCQLLGTVVENDGCEDDFLAFEDAFQYINAYSLAFARYHFDGDESHLDLLAGEFIPDPTLVVSFAPEVGASE